MINHLLGVGILGYAVYNADRVLEDSNLTHQDLLNKVSFMKQDDDVKKMFAGFAACAATGLYALFTGSEVACALGAAAIAATVYYDAFDCIVLSEKLSEKPAAKEGDKKRPSFTDKLKSGIDQAATLAGYSRAN